MNDSAQKIGLTGRAIATDADWYCVQSATTKEFVVASILNQQGIVALAPFKRSTRLVCKQVQSIKGPLFPGYLFAHLQVKNFYDQVALIKRTQCARDLVRIENVPVVVPVELMAQLLDRLDRNGILIEQEKRYDAIDPGTPVKFIDGPYTDKIASFSGMKGTERSIVLLTMLGAERAVQVNRGDFRIATEKEISEISS